MKMTDAIKALFALGYTVTRTSKDDEWQPLIVARNGTNTLRVYCTQRTRTGRDVERVEVFGLLAVGLAKALSASTFPDARVTAVWMTWVNGKLLNERTTNRKDQR